MMNIIRKTVIPLFLGCIIASCDNRQVRMNADQFHDGILKGYATVYIQDYENGVAVRDRSDDDMGYSVFEKEDGSYTIEYRGNEYSLYKLNDPERLFGTEYTYLYYSFDDGQHFIENIPSSY